MNSEKQGGRTKDVIHTTFKIQSELNFCVLNWEFDMCNIMLVTFLRLVLTTNHWILLCHPRHYIGKTINKKLKA